MRQKDNFDEPPSRTGDVHSANTGRPARGESTGGLSVDPWTMTDAVLRRWYWIALAAVLLAAAAYFFTKQRWHSFYTASVRLIRFEMVNSTAYYKPAQLTDATFASLLKAPELLKRVSEKSKPRISPESLTKRSVVSPTRESDVVVIMIGGMNLQSTIDLANLYAKEAVAYTREVQRKEASEVNEALKAQLAKLDEDMRRFNEQIVAAPPVSQRPAARRGYKEKS